MGLMEPGDDSQRRAGTAKRNLMNGNGIMGTRGLRCIVLLAHQPIYLGREAYYSFPSTLLDEERSIWESPFDKML